MVYTEHISTGVGVCVACDKWLVTSNSGYSRVSALSAKESKVFVDAWKWRMPCCVLDGIKFKIIELGNYVQLD